MQTMTAPGWYQDPGDEAALRLWDGGAWTDQLRRIEDLAGVPDAPAPAIGPAEAPARWAQRARGEVATVSGGRLGLRVLVAGLATLYAANALGAMIDPTPFLALIPGGAGHRWLGLVIGANDASVAAALVVTEWGRGRLAPARGWQGAVLAWAGVWLTLAAALKGLAL